MNNIIETPESNYGQLTIAEATLIQEKLRTQVRLTPMEGEIKTIAGADISLDLNSDIVYAGMVVLSYPDLKPIACSLVQTTNIFPYVPGYLAFREIPALLKVYEQIPVKPDCIMFDGNGILHKRRLGIATHFGVLTDTMTLGCAKKKLAGNYADPGETKGDYTLVTDRGETIGFALRSKLNVKPVFISPGHRMSLKDSMDITMKCLGKHRLPEPTRRAHEFVNRFRIGELKEGFHELEQWSLF
ncbi:deoxyribonuclease V [Dyadobacter psychrophilus]|uniref:Endonuclease V n=1 Tax=Dyadobacter psychrophilus TaxID=651661 RepID=A0A1T5FTH2_9BACT|nr:deoxyribonuclease V [Dyadobacter psychrophilus]SKB99452.1 Endonuclease V [Dyadobacter psychrophilus]